MDAAQRQPDARVDARGLALAALAGSLASLLAPFHVPVSIAWLLAIPPALLLPRTPRVLLLAALAGAAWSAWHAGQLLAERWPASRHGEHLELTAVVAGFPERDGDTLRLRLAPGADGLSRRIRAAWYAAGDAAEAVTAGSCWHWRLRMRTPRGSLNPGGFDYEAWLFREGIGASATVRDARPCAEARTAGWLDRTRQRLATGLLERIGERPGAGVLAALLVGDRSGISDAQWTAFRRTGTAHLVAISGLHVGLVAGIVGWLVFGAWRAITPAAQRMAAPRAALLASVLAALVYSALAGFALPTLRALCMVAAFALALSSGRRAAPSAVLALAAIAALLVDPLAPLRPGFWLSFGAVAVIAWTVAGRRYGWLAGLLRVQLALSLALAPLSALFFGGFSLAGLGVNLLAVPLMSQLLPVLMLGALLAPFDGGGLLTLATGALEAGLAALQFLGQAPAGWTALNLSPAAAALMLLATALLFAWRLGLWPLGLLCLLAVAVPPARPAPGAARIAFLDVGQGTAVVVETHRKLLLYDAGPAWNGGYDAGRMVVEPYLQHRRLRRVDRVIVSHGDRDHAGGTDYLRGAGWFGSRAAVPVGCVAGERWTWDGVVFETLHPPAVQPDENNASCVLRVAGNGWALLLPGDIEAGAERELLAAGTKLRADLLLAPHHGSRSSSSQAFIEAVDPEIVVHSAGWRHRFGHPHHEVVARYESVGARQLCTADDGAITAIAGRDGIELQRERARSPAIWRAGNEAERGACER